MLQLVEVSLQIVKFEILNEKRKISGWKIHIPSIEYTTDNAAMIGIAGYYNWKNKNFSDFSSVANSRMSF